MASKKFNHLLQTNYPPNEEESEDMRDLIRALNEEIEVLHNKRAQERWRWRRSNLDKRIHRLTRDVQRCSAVLSPIRIIPAELIEHIFLFCPSIGTSPWILCGVCRDWRRSAFATPLLWIQLPIITIGSKRLPRTLEGYAEALRYSSNSPLIVRITMGSELEWTDFTTINPTVALLASHSHRWHSVDIALPPIVMGNLSPLIENRLQGLNHLRLNFKSNFGVSRKEIDGFSDTPLLKSLHILGTAPQNLQVPAPNLLSLTCEWPPPFSPPVLLCFTKLECLNITYNGFTRNHDPVHMLVPKLQACTLFFEWKSQWAGRNKELRPAIEAVVRNRCEPPPCATNARAQEDIQRLLQVFELGGQPCISVYLGGTIFSKMLPGPLFAQADFENWVPTEGLKPLVDLHDRLVNLTPCLYDDYYFETKRSVESPTHVHAILDAIEAMDQLNPFDILISNLHNAIEKLITRHFQRVHGTQALPNFPQADRIVKKWKILIAPHLDQVHWVYANPGYDVRQLFMVYIRNDHPNRTSEKMKDAVIGKDDDFLFSANQPNTDSDVLSFREYSAVHPCSEWIDGARLIRDVDYSNMQI